LDEIESIKKEAKALTESGVDIIIAVGHSGFVKDKEIAEKVPQVDVVVGGNNLNNITPARTLFISGLKS
jgi:5'-nucleotidase